MCVGLLLLPYAAKIKALTSALPDGIKLLILMHAFKQQHLALCLVHVISIFYLLRNDFDPSDPSRSNKNR